MEKLLALDFIFINKIKIKVNPFCNPTNIESIETAIAFGTFKRGLLNNGTANFGKGGSLITFSI